jgi:hypothetical protein
MIVWDYFLLITVGLLWGTTNYLMDITLYESTDDQNKQNNIIKRTYNYISKNYKPLLFFGLNQLGSVLFYFSLSKLSI